MDRRSSLKMDESCVGSKVNVYKQNGEPLKRLNIIRVLLLAVVAVQGVVAVGDNAEDMARERHLATITPMSSFIGRSLIFTRALMATSAKGPPRHVFIRLIIGRRHSE